MLITRRKFAEMLLENPALIGGLLGFAFLSAVIVSNAVFFQVEKHPAPLFGAMFSSSQYGVGQQSIIPVPRIQPVLVGEIQQELFARGYYGGDIDGRIGPKTRSAILAFQRAENRPPTGVVTRQLLAEIQNSDGKLLPDDESIPAQTASIEEPDPILGTFLTEDQVLRVQAALDKLGYGPIQIDGVNGAQTIAAVKGFQLDHGMTPDGRITTALVTRIEIFGGVELTQ